jgi:hypothetical protein
LGLEQKNLAEVSQMFVDLTKWRLDWHWFGVLLTSSFTIIVSSPSISMLILTSAPIMIYLSTAMILIHIQFDLLLCCWFPVALFFWQLAFTQKR